MNRGWRLDEPLEIEQMTDLIDETAPGVAALVAQNHAVFIGYTRDAIPSRIFEDEAHTVVTHFLGLPLPGVAELVTQADEVAIPITVHLLPLLILKTIESGADGPPASSSAINHLSGNRQVKLYLR